MNILTIYRNNKYPKLLAIALLFVSFSVVSCDKDEDEVVTPTAPPAPPPAPENPTVSFTDGSGTLTAIQSRTFQSVPFFGGFFPVDNGLAVAVFYDDPTSGTFSEAGTIECNSEGLTNNSNSYIFTPSLDNATGIDFAATGEVEWAISGSTAGGNVPEMTLTNYQVFPDLEKISSELTVDRTQDYSLETTRAWSADSLIFMIGGIYHTVENGNTSYTFTAAELSTLTAGPNYAQITGYNVTQIENDGKTYHMVNETVITESITLQ